MDIHERIHYATFILIALIAYNLYKPNIIFLSVTIGVTVALIYAKYITHQSGD